LFRVTYIFLNARFKKRKIIVDILMYHEYGVVTDGPNIRFAPCDKLIHVLYYLLIKLTA